jgi:cytochrome c-type biogenesis protein CcmH
MRALAAVGLLVILAGCAPAPASVEARARRIESQVWSPYCPGRLLSDCSTRQAADLRDEIETRLRRGETEADVMAWLRSNYGEQVLARPEASGAGLAVWLVPLAVIAAGAVLVVGLIRRWSAQPVKPAAEDTGLEDWTRRVRDEVERDL